MSKMELIKDSEYGDEHIQNIEKTIDIATRRFQAQLGSETKHSSFGFGVGRNWIEAGLMTAGMQLLTGAVSKGMNRRKKNKALAAVSDKIEELVCDEYYEKFVKKNIKPEEVTNKNLMDIAKNTCWALGA